MKKNSIFTKNYVETYHSFSGQLAWPGVAVYVSKQVRCSITNIDKILRALNYLSLGLPMFSTSELSLILALRYTRRSLGEVQYQIHSSIYPILYCFGEVKKIFSSRSETENFMRSCFSHLMNDPDKRSIIEALLAENWGAASSLIATFEQEKIAQAVYEDKQILKIQIQMNEGIERLGFEAFNNDVTLSTECATSNKSEEIKLEGSLLNPDDRVKYYQKLEAAFLQMPKNKVNEDFQYLSSIEED